MTLIRADRGATAKRRTLIGVLGLAVALSAWLFQDGASARRVSGPAPMATSPVVNPAGFEPPLGFTTAAAAIAGPAAPLEPDRTRVVFATGYDDAEVAEARRAPRTEREFYGSYLQVLRDDPDAADALVQEVLAGSGPDCRRLALLRALYDLHLPAVESAVLEVLTRRDTASATPNSEPLAVVVSVFLGRHAARDAMVRRVLETAAFERGTEMPIAVRRRCAAAWSASIDENEMERFPWRLHAEVDALCVEAMIAALRENPRCEAVARLMNRLGLDRAAAEPTVPNDG